METERETERERERVTETDRLRESQWKKQNKVGVGETITISKEGGITGYRMSTLHLSLLPLSYRMPYCSSRTSRVNIAYRMQQSFFCGSNIVTCPFESTQVTNGQVDSHFT